jgi:hypothetical protein
MKLYWCLLCSPKKIGGAYSRRVVRQSVSTSWIGVRPITLLFEVGFYNYFTEMITILRLSVTRKIWVATLKVKVTAWSCSKNVFCPYNFVIWSRILQLFHRNDYHIETTCRTQHLVRYLEGQGHSMTLQQNWVRPITSLIEVGFYNLFTEMITKLRRVARESVVISHWVEVQCKEQ